MEIMTLYSIFARETTKMKTSKVNGFVYNTIPAASGSLLCLCFKTRTLGKRSPHLPCEPLVQSPLH